jgi:transcriptional regulator with XRE-family HTH domain
MLTPQQIRAARAHLDLSQDDVAEGTGLTKYTLSNIERGATEGSSKSLEVLQAFFERRGLVFTQDNGIRVLKSDVRSYEGMNGFQEFMWDVYDTMKAHPGTYCVSNVDERNWIRWMGPEQMDAFVKKMMSLKNVHAHIIIKEGDEVAIDHHAEYRTISADLFYDNTCFYVYADKLALIRFEPNNVIVRVLQNKYFSESFKLMFYRFWDKFASKIALVPVNIPEYAEA